MTRCFSFQTPHSVICYSLPHQTSMAVTPEQCDNSEEDAHTYVRTQAGHTEDHELEMKQNEAYGPLNSPSTHEFDDYDYV